MIRIKSINFKEEERDFIIADIINSREDMEVQISKEISFDILNELNRFKINLLIVENGKA